jgi:PTS system nitrogen regulatory IIA component
MLLTVQEAARLLSTTERRVYRWVDEEEIPFQRMQDQVRFNRTDLLEWATSRRLSVSLQAFDAGLDPEDRAPSLARALEIGGVHAGVAATDREGALRAIVERTPMPAGVDRGFVFEVLLARGSTSSTAIGEGIAIPHVRQPVVAPGAAAAVSVTYLDRPVPFGAADGKGVHTVFLVVSPTVRTHLQILAHLAHALLDAGFREALGRRAPLEALVAEAERLEQLPPTPPPPRGDRGAAD